jgi:GNAT superfamily N-acetyltransferase
MLIASKVGPAEIVQVDSSAARNAFIDLPFRLYQNDQNWRPPIRSEVRDLIAGSARRNPWFDHAELGLWIAVRDREVVGRISGQCDRLVQDHVSRGTGHWGMFECIDDRATASALLNTAERWLQQRGMVRSLGPFSLSIWDECGLLVRGFDTPPTVMMGHHHNYYSTLIEAHGYVGVKDLHSYRVILEELPERIGRLVALAGANSRIRIRKIDKSKFEAEGALILDMLNDAWAGNWGFVPMTAAEIAFASRKLKPIVYEDLIYIAEIDGLPAGFMLSLPDLNEMTADLDGRLLPFGWAKLLLRLRAPKTQRIRVPLMGVRKMLQRSRLASLMTCMMIERTRQAAVSRYGASEAELGWVLDDNDAMVAMAEAGGGEIAKTYRIYERALT